MPRTPNRKALSDGWKKINYLKKIALTEKVEQAHKLLEFVFHKHRNPVLCWSGGKDSTVALHLSLQHLPDIQVFHIDTGVLFPETISFIKKISKKWDLNLKIIKSEVDFWDIGKKFGWPIYGKSIASNVERAIRTGNIRDKLSAFEKMLVNNNIKLSMKCSEYLLDKPTKKVEKEYSADLKILGIRALESRARVRLWVDYGDYYYIKRYFKRNEGIWKCSPIFIWTTKDIWKYNKENNIPHCKLYDVGYDRNGCWTCAMAIRNGQLNNLKMNHPDLYKKLLMNTDMGKEIYKSYKTIIENKNIIGFNLDYFRPIIEDLRLHYV